MSEVDYHLAKLTVRKACWEAKRRLSLTAETWPEYRDKLQARDSLWEGTL